MRIRTNENDHDEGEVENEPSGVPLRLIMRIRTHINPLVAITLVVVALGGRMVDFAKSLLEASAQDDALEKPCQFCVDTGNVIVETSHDNIDEPGVKKRKAARRSLPPHYRTWPPACSGQPARR